MSTFAEKLAPTSTIHLNGIAINYVATLKPSGPTLVLVHGFGATLQTWHDIYTELSTKYSVIALDLKGSGFSEKPRDGRYSPDDQAQLVSMFLSKLKLTNVVLVGHSLGGGIALLTALSAAAVPIVEPSAPCGLILIDSAGFPLRLPFFVSAQLNAVARNLSYLLPATIRARIVLNKIFTVREQITLDRLQRYAFFLDLPGSRYALHHTAKQLTNNDDISDRFETIKLPTLIIWGENDPVIPVRDANRFASDIKGSQVTVLPNTGHVPHEERPQDVIVLIDRFLRSFQ